MDRIPGASDNEMNIAHYDNDVLERTEVAPGIFRVVTRVPTAFRALPVGEDGVPRYEATVGRKEWFFTDKNAPVIHNGVDEHGRVIEPLSVSLWRSEQPSDDPEWVKRVGVRLVSPLDFSFSPHRVVPVDFTPIPKSSWP